MVPTAPPLVQSETSTLEYGGVLLSVMNPSKFHLLRPGLRHDGLGLSVLRPSLWWLLRATQ